MSPATRRRARSCIERHRAAWPSYGSIAIALRIPRETARPGLHRRVLVRGGFDHVAGLAEPGLKVPAVPTYRPPEGPRPGARQTCRGRRPQATPDLGYTGVPATTRHRQCSRARRARSESSRSANLPPARGASPRCPPNLPGSATPATPDLGYTGVPATTRHRQCSRARRARSESSRSANLPPARGASPRCPPNLPGSATPATPDLGYTGVPATTRHRQCSRARRARIRHASRHRTSERAGRNRRGEPVPAPGLTS